MNRVAVSSLLLVVSACGGHQLREPTASPSPAAPVAPVSVSGAATEEAKEASLRSEGALVLDGVPEIPEALRERVGRYLETRSAASGGLSDDGRSMLVETRFGQTNQVHWVRQPMGARTQLTFVAEPARSPTFVPGGARSIAYLSDSGGNERYQIFRQDLDTGVVTRLTDGQSRNPAFAWSRSGSKLAYSSNARNGRDMDLWTSDGKQASSAALLLERKGHWVPLEWSRDEKQLLVMEYVSINESQLFLVDAQKKSALRLTPESPRASYRAAVLGPAGDKLYVTTDRDGEFIELYEVNVAAPAQPWKPLSRHIHWNVEELALSDDGSTLAFTTNEDGSSRLHLLDTRSRKEKLAEGVPSGIISGLGFARKAKVLGFGFASATTPGDAFSYDVARKKLTRWTESEVGGLPPSRFVEPTLIHVKSFDGLEVPAFYYAPKQPGPHPVLVWIHGGPESQARPTFSSLMQYLVVESSIAVLVPNVRGSDGYGKSYLLLDNGDKRENSVRDIGALLDWVATRPELDAKRVAVIGGSYGGYMVLSSLFNYANRLVAGVDVVGISNFVTFLENTQAYRRDLRRAEYGDERIPEMRRHLLAISPTTNASKITSALFVAQGANDPRVPATEAEQIVREVRKRGRDVWYMLAKNEGHGFSKKENRDAFALLSVLFLEKQLGVKK